MSLGKKHEILQENEAVIHDTEYMFGLHLQLFSRGNLCNLWT
jgi:hypothetical protein